MRSASRYTSLAILCLLFVGGYTLNTATVFAASSPQFLVTWRSSGSYIPSFYIGKALPTYGSNIAADLELLSQGHLVDLSSQTIYWYLDSTLIGGGVGVQSVSFPPFGEPPSTLDLKVVIPNYNGAYLSHTLEIPMVNPQTVIYAPYANNQVSNNTTEVEALPYFFNTPQAGMLSYAWSVNDQTGASAENPTIAQISVPTGTPSGSPLSISLTVTNPQDSTQSTASTVLVYEKQL